MYVDLTILVDCIICHLSDILQPHFHAETSDRQPVTSIRISLLVFSSAVAPFGKCADFRQGGKDVFYFLQIEC
jgi:hypothetical protein